MPGYDSNGKRDVVLAKVDKAGTVLWQKQWGHAENEYPYQMVRHSDGSLYMTVMGRADDGTLTAAYIVITSYSIHYTKLYESTRRNVTTCCRRPMTTTWCSSARMYARVSTLSVIAAAAAVRQ